MIDNECQTCLGTSRLLCIFISAPVGVRDLVKVVRIRFISQAIWWMCHAHAHAHTTCIFENYDGYGTDTEMSDGLKNKIVVYGNFVSSMHTLASPHTHTHSYTFSLPVITFQLFSFDCVYVCVFISVVAYLVWCAFFVVRTTGRALGPTQRF